MYGHLSCPVDVIYLRRRIRPLRRAISENRFDWSVVVVRYGGEGVRSLPPVTASARRSTTDNDATTVAVAAAAFIVVVVVAAA